MGGSQLDLLPPPVMDAGGKAGMAYFSDAFLRKASSILARLTDGSEWGGGLGYFVPHVAMVPAESSLSSRMDERDGLMVSVQLTVQLKSEVPDLGGREEKQTVTVCPQPPGELWQSKQQGQMRERSFVAENLLYLILNAAAY